MKKLFSSILMLALLAFSACQDNLTPNIVNNKGDHPVFHVSFADEGTRTQLNSSLQMEWAAGDQICIKCGDKTAIYGADEAGTLVEFSYVSGDELPATGSFEAFYPASLGTAAVLPASQVYAAGNISGLPMHATSTDHNLTFKHLCGILELVLSTSDTGIEVNGIMLQSAEGMSGAFTVEEDVAKLGEDKGDVVMKIETPVALSATATKFYLAVPAGTYAAGTSFIVQTTNGWRVFKTNKPFTFSRAHITPTTLTVAADKIYKARTTNDAKANWSYFNTLNDAIAAVTDNGAKADCEVQMLCDMALATAIEATTVKKFTLNGWGYTLDASNADCSALTSEIKAALTFTDVADVTVKDFTIDGGSTDPALGYRAFRLAGGNGTKLTLSDDAVIQNFYATGSGGAISNHGVTLMESNSLITNCKSTEGSGGAIIMTRNNSSCYVKMTGNSSISECTSHLSGGAVYYSCEYTGAVPSLSLLDNASISYCSSETKSGGAYCGYKLTMSGKSSINNCSAKDGGGVYAQGPATFNDDASVSNCTASNYGGGVYAKASVTFNDNTSICDCNAAAAGGVYNNRNTFFMKGSSSISNCSVTGNGGGIILTESASFTMDGTSAIRNCSSGASGGAIRIINKGTATIGSETDDNPSISGCSSTSGGSAVSITSGSFTVNRGHVSADTEKAMIYCTGGTVNIHGGYYLQSGSGSMFSNSGGTFKTDCTESPCYISKTTSLLTSGFSKRALSTSSAEYIDGYRYEILPPAAAMVNGVSYPFISEAFDAAKAYDGENSSVTIQLLRYIGMADEFSKSVDLTNKNGKHIILDLNNFTLEANVKNAFTTTGTLTFTDNSEEGNGKIINSAGTILKLTSACTVNIQKCSFECTAPSYGYIDWDYSAIALYGSSMAQPTLTISGSAKIYTTNSYKVIYVRYANLTTSDCEILCGGNYYSIFTNKDANVTINEGTSIYAKPTDDKYGCIRLNSTPVCFVINGGYFYGGKVFYESSYNTNVTLNGGYYSSNIADLTNKPVLGTGKSFATLETAETRTQVSNGASCTYGYQVVPTAD